MQGMRRNLKKLLLLLLGVLLMVPPGLLSTSANAEVDDDVMVTVYHETFADGVGITKVGGNAHLKPIDKMFDGNDNDKAIYVNERLNNYDGIDIHFDDVNMKDGQTYTIQVTGYIDEDVEVPEGAQVLLQNIDSYEGLYVNENFEAGETFTLIGQYTVNMNKDHALRIQSNDHGKEIPFYIGDILITGKENHREQEKPEESRPPAKEFTTIDFENRELSGFEPRGDHEKLTITDETNNTDHGSYALKVEDREKAWNGPSLRVEEYIDLGQEYKISVWIKLISTESVDLQLSTQIGEGGSASYNNIERKTISAEDGWVQLEGTYRYSSVGEEYVTIYIESPNHETVSFYIDDINFEPTGSGSVDINTDLPPIKDIYGDHFLIGNAVSSKEFSGQRLELLKMHHNLVTAENAMKPGEAYNDEGGLDLTDENKLVANALEEGFKVHGHVLVWHQQSNESLHTDADGEPLSNDKALTNLRNHVKSVVENFGENVISWDVVNEAMNDNPQNPEDWKNALRNSGWLKAIGPDYIEESFRAAKEVIDDNGWDIKLYYNDYNDDNQNKATAIEHMVKEINEKYAAENNGELLIDGIGMQGHYNLNTNPENVRLSLEKFIALGVEVGVTELDVTAGTDNELTEEQANQQAYLYAQLFQLYKEHSDHISRVTFWGLDDGSSWRAAQSPLLFDRNMQAKPAYYAVIDPEGFIENYEPDIVDAREGKGIYGTPVLEALKDGVIEEVWNHAEKLSIDRYQGAWHGANGTARVLWDDEHLYVLVEVNDSTLDKTATEKHEQDSVEVFLDENNGKTSYYQDDDGQYRVNFDNEMSFNPASIAEGFESVAYQSEDGYKVGMKIPFKKVNPKQGKVIGFDVQINDAVNGSRQSVAIWNDTSGVGYQDTSVFGNLRLVKVEDLEPSPKPEPKPEPKPDPNPKPELDSDPILETETPNQSDVVKTVDSGKKEIDKMTGEIQGKVGQKLPTTATNIFNLFILGLVLLLLGLGYILISRKKRV